jgi:hypothetical protein
MLWYSILTSFGCFQTQIQSMRRCGRSEGSSGESRDPEGAGAQQLFQPDRSKCGNTIRPFWGAAGQAVVEKEAARGSIFLPIPGSSIKKNELP